MEIFRNIVFDVGCNIGDKSESFLNLDAKVVGFEPQVECFESGDIYCKSMAIAT